MTRVVVLTGSGGVGKTTTAAAIAVGLADAGLRTAVLTIDPALRLAQALGVGELGGAPAEVTEVPGLSALMLDQSERFGAMLAEAGAPELAGNAVTRAMARSFGGLQEYLAMDLLGALHDSGEWDAIVVDTPPALSALELLDSAERMGRLLDHPLMRLLTSSSALVGAGVTVVGKVIGSAMLAQVAAFAKGARPVMTSVLDRSRRMRATLESSGEFLVVGAPAAEALREARGFARTLGDQGLAPKALVVNRVHPVAEVLDDVPLPDLEAADPDAAAVHRSRVELAEAEEKQICRFARRVPGVPVTRVPSLRGGVDGVGDLRRMAALVLPALGGAGE
ncbi:ArsA family ATPase [Corynebacterium sp. 335C]